MFVGPRGPGPVSRRVLPARNNSVRHSGVTENSVPKPPAGHQTDTELTQL